MSTKKSTQSTATRGKVVALPICSMPRIDVEKLLLQGQSTPTVLVPKELQQAIDARARALSEEAYTLCREHLQRRVAYTSEIGLPRTLHMANAFAVIENGDLGEALAHEYSRKLSEIKRAATLVLNASVEFDQEINAALADGGRTA